MARDASPPWSLVWLVVGSLLGPGCQARQQEQPPQRAVSPLLLDCRQQEEETPQTCRHVWQQVDVHAYTRVIHGLPSVELCSVLRCARCGLARHECSPPPRR